MKVGDLVMDYELGLRGIIVHADSYYPGLWHILFEDNVKATAFANALKVISESR